LASQSERRNAALDTLTWLPSKTSKGTAAFRRAGELENGAAHGVRSRLIAVPLLHSFTKTLDIWYNTRMQRTIRLKLTPSVAQADALAETSRQFTAVFNAVCAVGWQQRITNGVKLHHATYYPLKAGYPALVSDLLVQARVKATEAVKSAFALQRAGRKVGMPVSDICPPRYNVHTYKVDWESQTVRMSLIGGRQTIRFDVPDYSAKYAGYPTASADLLFRHGYWWLYVVVTIPTPDIAPTDQVVGVDLGIARPAVTSNNRFLGKRAWKSIEGKLFHLKRALQKKGRRETSPLPSQQRSYPLETDCGIGRARRDGGAGKPDRHSETFEGQAQDPNQPPYA
jgi:predicted transposase